MGLGNSTHAVFLSIVDGKISRRYKEEQPGITKQRQTSTGKIVHEQFFDHLSGFITEITTTTHKDYGDFLNVTMVDGDERFILQTNLDGGYGRAILKILPNIDFIIRTTIIPSMKMEENKKKVTVFINQGTKALKHYFTFNDPKGMPNGNKLMYKGKEVYDYTDQIKFLLSFFEKNLKPKMIAAANKLPSIPQGTPATTTVKTDNSPGTVSDAQYEEDDLPF